MDLNSHNWDAFWQKSRYVNISWSKKRILRVIQPFMKSGMRILDAGCGSGFFSAFFCDYNMNVTAVDYSKQALTITKIKTSNRARILKADLMKDEFPDLIKEAFDLIFTDGLFEHFSHYSQNLIYQNFLHVLKPDGFIITFVPNLFSPWTLIRPWLMPGIKEKPFTLNRLKKLNERNGSVIIGAGGVNVFPWRYSPERILGSRFGMLLYTVAQPKNNKNRSAS